MYEREQFRIAKAAQQSKYNWEYGNQDLGSFGFEFSHGYWINLQLCSETYLTRFIGQFVLDEDDPEVNFF